MLRALRKANRPMSLEELTTGPGDKARAEVLEQLGELIQRGDVVVNRRGQYCLREQLHGVTAGTVQALRNGDGLRLPDEGSDAR